jgi:hypothetical protein
MLVHQVLDAEQGRRGQSVIEKFMGELQRPVNAADIRGNLLTLNLQAVSRVYEAAGRAPLDPALAEAA